MLVTASRGYQLAVEPGSVDAQEFVRLAEQGRAALDGDDPELAAAVLRRALELWHDPPHERPSAGPQPLNVASRHGDLTGKGCPR